MSNMRIVSDNAVDRAILTASSEASASMSVGNLLKDLKSSVWRTNPGTFIASVMGRFSTTETLSCAVLPFCNFSPTAKMRVQVTNEPSATNLFTYSEQFDNAAWLVPGSRATITPNAILAPNGTVSADQITTNGSGAAYYYQSKPVSSGSKYVVSAFFKAGSYSGNVTITDYTEAGTATFNLSTSNVSSSGIASLPSVQDVGGGWLRCSATFTPTSSGNHNIGLGGVSTAGNFYMWGAQMEADNLTSYYPSTASASVRPAGYMDSWQTYGYDSGDIACCPEPVVKLRGWTPAQSASAYAYGGGATARIWFPPISALGFRVTIKDPNNIQGYLEAARLIVASYWEAEFNPSEVRMSFVDTTKIGRLDSDDQWSDQGKVHKAMKLTLSGLAPDDRPTFINLIRNSRAYPIFVSVFPQVSDVSLEGDHMVYGRRTNDSEIVLQAALIYNSELSIESI